MNRTIAHSNRTHPTFAPRRVRPALSALQAALVLAASVNAAGRFEVTSTADDGSRGTLRWAIEQANRHDGSTIAFKVRGRPARIVVTADLPPITKTTRLDGRTQPGYVDHPLVTVMGAGFPGFFGLVENGLVFSEAPRSEVYGLAICGFGSSDFVGANVGDLKLVRCHDSRIAGCWIGIDADGVSGGSQLNGLILQDCLRVQVGGAGSVDRNVISGSLMAQLRLMGGGHNQIINNRIGTDPLGGLGLARGTGIRLDNNTEENTIGGWGETDGNLISGNGAHGIFFVGARRNQILRNRIGLKAGGPRESDSPLPNGLHGISIGWQGVCTGNVVQANTIAFNGRCGVAVYSVRNGTRQNPIIENRIYQNQRLGIDLVAGPPSVEPAVPHWDPLDGDGVTSNDRMDPDTGPNELQNFPELTKAQLTSTGFQIEGSLDSRPDSLIRIDLYWSDARDPSGYGEGREFLRTIWVTTDATGQASIRTDCPPWYGGGFISATATDSSGNTSEFSQGVPLTP